MNQTSSAGQTNTTRRICSAAVAADAGPNEVTASAWPLERALFLMAGTFVLAGALLAALVSPWFLLLTAFVAVNQLLYVAARDCGASIMLKRFTSLKSAVYPNR